MAFLSSRIQETEAKLLVPLGRGWNVGKGATGFSNVESSLSSHMNGHQFITTVSNPDLPVAINTQSHQIPFQECWSVSVMHKLPDYIPDHICSQFETAYQLVLQFRHTPGLNIR